MTPLDQPPTTSWARRALAAFVVAALALITVPTATVGARGGVTEQPYEYGFFYGTFGESPNTFLLAGGTVEEFCESDPAGGPGTTTARVRELRDGSTVFRVRDRAQPIHLYSVDVEGVPPWLDQTCAEYAAGEPVLQPFASGTAQLAVRDRVFTDGRVDVFNAVLGRATGTDGTRYRVAGWADFEVVDGVPQGDPADFVGFVLRAVGR